MAKKERELSPAEKALLDARQKHEVAVAADTKASTDKTKANVEATKAEVAKHSAVVKRESFVRVGGGRVKKARLAIRNIGNIANPRSYTYSEDDIGKLEKALSEEAAKIVSKLRLSLTKGPAAAKADDDFTF